MSVESAHAAILVREPLSGCCQLTPFLGAGRKSSMKIILSHPYSGAVHWWFGQLQRVGGDQALKRPYSGYYRTLYGSDIDNFIDIALACLVIFDEIVIPAADAAFPGEFLQMPDG